MIYKFQKKKKNCGKIILEKIETNSYNKETKLLIENSIENGFMLYK